ncbi:MAG: SRPBCC family protein [Gaiellaceae bacterium]
MKRVLMFLLIVVLAFVGFVATRPAQFRVVRSGSVSAPPSVVYAQIADFHNWPAWSPWEHLDPAMTRSITGAASGVGAIYDWTGNDKVGQGRMTIMDATPDQKVSIKLEFMKPFQATNVTTFALTPNSDGTSVEWSMEGRNNFVSKAMCIFMPMDKMVGGDFERGLASLKQVAEQGSAAAADSAAGH